MAKRLCKADNCSKPLGNCGYCYMHFSRLQRHGDINYQSNRSRTGLSGSSTQGVWRGLRQRCLNPNNKDYHNYGARGITVCDRWSRFENFLDDMGEKPNGMTIDRINNDGNYEPSNCRWATKQQQGENRRTTLKYEGLTVREWAERLGVHPQTLKAKAAKEKGLDNAVKFYEKMLAALDDQNIAKCTKCSGQGKLHVGVNVSVPCPECHGTGKVKEG